MSGEVTIHLYTSVLDGQRPVRVWSAARVRWRQTWTDGVGPETARMTIRDAPETLAALFYSALGYHIEAWLDGICVWEGLVYEMDLHAGAIARRRSLADMYNHIRCAYIDETNTSQMSAAASNADSIARYGRREDIVTLDGYNTSSADAYAATRLRQAAYPWPRPSGQARGVRLDVQLAGYALTGNWRHVSGGDGSTSTASAWLAEILTADAEFMAGSDISANSLSVVKVPRPTRRAWGAVQEIASLGDASGNPWRVYWDTGRTVHYERVPTSPRYTIHGDALRRYPDGARVSPWLVRPAVVRDTAYMVRPAESGSWLDDPRDAYIHSVTVSHDGRMTLRFGEYDDVGIADAVASYRDEVERWQGE